MVKYRIIYSRKAQKDIDLLKNAGLSEKAKRLVEILREDPFRNPPPFEKLVGKLKGFYSRRINHQHRLVYQVRASAQEVVIISLWSHYEDV